MKIIDAHMHYSNITSFKQTATELAMLDYSYAGIEKEYADAGVVFGIAMGVTETKVDGFPDYDAPTPMGIDLEENVPPFIGLCPGVNPYGLDATALHALEQQLQLPHVVGIKIYLGYYPFYAYDDVYTPVYALARKYSLPVVYHTGDTYSERGLLKYAHPLTIDEVAVQHRDINFMLAHFGDPWVLDAAEVLYKNRNVFADLSGLVVGTQAELQQHLPPSRFFSHLQHALTYTDDYSKFLFGTDWPLAPIQPYIDMIRALTPAEAHNDIFYNNALHLFPKIQALL